MRYTLTALLTTAGTALAMLAGAGAADAAPVHGTVQQQIDGILAKNPDAVQTGKSTVTLDKGAVTLRLAGATGAESCGSDQFCLWEDIDFGGRMVSWKGTAALCSPSRYVNLTEYGFNDRASSWVNNSDYVVDVWEDIDKGGARLWTMYPGSSSSVAPDGDSSSSLNCYA
ncbi:peptidase inhibitor family I36 protein [Streptomyces sp. NPDC091217]|uniref:peptidase inhibitor family I36 protein n=1 Tax=Streptomyces sp. NPDC091217 TaxID=3365975 RepID=UPI00380BB474